MEPAGLDAPEQRIELRTYRLLCLGGALFVPALGLAYRLADPTGFDPLWLRGAIAVIPLGLLLGSYASAELRAHLPRLIHLLTYVVLLWYGVVVALNGLTPEYAVGFFVVLGATGAAVSASVQRVAALAIHLGVGSVLAAACAVVLPGPGVDPLVFVGGLAAATTLLFVVFTAGIQTRAHLRARVQRYRAVIESATGGLFLVDAESLRFVNANEAYCDLVGYTEEELRQLTLPEIVVDRSEHVERLVRKARELGRLTVPEQEHRHKDGGTVYLEIGLTLLHTDGEAVLCGTAHDLTEQKRIRRELERAKEDAEEMLRLKSTFLNNMSHELRTPMVAICGFAEMLEEDLDEEYQEVIGSLSRSARRLYDTLNSVLDLAQFESGEVNLKLEVTDVAQEVAGVVEMFQPMAEQKGLALTMHVDERARALLDRGGFQRIVTNLVSNALKFTDVGGVTVAVAADSHRVLVHVRDTGVGIEAAFLPHLFEEFKQASTGIARSHEGNGLGLTITKRLVDLMGGRIMVESTVGEGTIFTVAFARTWADPEEVFASRADSAQAPRPLLTSRPRVLVVEDNADTRRLIAYTLEAHYDVEAAETGEAALQLAQQNWYDLVLVDLHLGAGMNGLELLQWLRRMSAYAYVPMVALTAFARPGDAERFLEAGFDEYLAKPFTRDELIWVLERARSAQNVRVES